MSFDSMVDEGIKYYRDHGRKIGDHIPSDAKLAEILGVPNEVFYQVRQMMRPAYQYRHCLDESWEVVFIPRNGTTALDKIESNYQDAKLNSLAEDFRSYMKSCAITDMASYKQAKADGLTYALSNQPSLDTAYQAYRAWFGRNGASYKYNRAVTPKTATENLGHRVQITIASVCKEFHPHGKKRIVKPEVYTLTKRDKSGENTSISKHYRDWCEKHDFVPGDAVLAHFLDCNYNALVYVRKTLIEKGWKFERVPNGWNIVKPEKPKTLEEMSKDELLAMLKKLVEK
jgi:hypothetical protein